MNFEKPMYRLANGNRKMAGEILEPLSTPLSTPIDQDDWDRYTIDTENDMPPFESFDYDASDDTSMYNSMRENSAKETSKKDIWRWTYVILIGVITGSIAYWMTYVVGRLVFRKFDDVFNLMQEGKGVKAFFLYLGWVIFSILPAALLVVWAPEAGERLRGTWRRARSSSLDIDVNIMFNIM